MKKTTSLILACALILVMCACSSTEKYEYNPSELSKGDITDCVKDGVMPAVTVISADAGEAETADVKLGMSLSEIERIFGKDTITVTEDEKYKKVTAQSAYIYFDNKDTDKGVVSIVSLDPVFNFSVNDTIQSVVDVLGDADSKDDVGEKDLFFFPYLTGLKAKRLIYESGDNKLGFYFISDNLSAMTLSVSDLW